LAQVASIAQIRREQLDMAPPEFSPAIFSIPFGFVAIWVISLLDFRKRPAIARAGYDEQRVRAETRIGAAGLRHIEGMARVCVPTFDDGYAVKYLSHSPISRNRQSPNRD